MKKKSSDRVLDALVKAIEVKPTPQLVSEFRSLLPVTVEVERVKELEKAHADLSERFRKMESDQAEMQRYIETLMAVNGVRKPDAPADAFQF